MFIRQNPSLTPYLLGTKIFRVGEFPIQLGAKGVLPNKSWIRGLYRLLSNPLKVGGNYRESSRKGHKMVQRGSQPARVRVFVNGKELRPHHFPGREVRETWKESVRREARKLAGMKYGFQFWERNR
jgi:hypothetical protein